jgi:CheY-like chemotaxis protein
MNSESSKKGKNIIVIDDESITLKMTKESLERMGFNVAIFSNAQKALDYFLDNHDSIDLVLSDKSMPKMNGFELTRQIRRVSSELPVFILTGYASNEDDETIKSIGVTKLLFKPISMKELASEIEEVLNLQP